MGGGSVIDKQTLERASLKPMRSTVHINKWSVCRADRSANRWLDWTGMLLERLTLRATLFQRPYVVLRADVGVVPANTYVSRWSYVLQQLIPRISLAITHLLKNDGMQPDLTNSFGISAVHTLEKRVFFGRNTLVMQERRNGSKSDPKPMNTYVLPVQRVLSRTTTFSGIDEVVERQASASTILTEMCDRAVRRVRQKCERIEERRMQSLVLRREARTIEATGLDSRPKEIVTTSPWGTAVGKPGFAMTNGQMPIDLNRLTDQVVRQIDSRIVAYRERMGKVF